MRGQSGKWLGSFHRQCSRVRARSEVECPTPIGWGDLACPSPPLWYESASSLMRTSSSGWRKAVVELWTGCQTGAMQTAHAGIGIGRGPADSNESACNVPKSASIRAPTRSRQQAPGHIRPCPGLQAQVYTFSETLSSTGSHRLAQTRWRRAARSWPLRTGLGLDARWRRAAKPVGGEHPAFFRFRH
jgi:hypothetical protein